jgi:hypothetical protein
MSFSILHISDLHRDLLDEVGNTWLLDSLGNDFAHFATQTPPIIKPSLCVVSGDIVYGIKPNTPNAAVEIKRQYKQAEEFLVGVADRFFGGDRNCVILLPGNHDVCFDDVIASTKKVDIPFDPIEKAKLVRQLSLPNSNIRWSWHELCFYEIVDETRYARRFENFAEMYRSFYNGHRSYSPLPQNQFDVFDFPSFSFSLLALNSCYNNDPLRRSGDIHPNVLTSACSSARDVARSGWLVAAAWHHNLSGGPAQDDYLDPAFVQLLMDAGVTLSFHGHQHLSECFDERYRLGPGKRKMTIVSAGTLCAEPKNLRPGEPRGYNIVEILSDRSIGRVHQRRMVNMIFNLPVWGPGYFINTNSSFFEFDICEPLMVRPSGLDTDLIIARAENFIGLRQWREAVDIMTGLRGTPIARPLIAKALSEIDEPSLTIATLWPPLTVGEAVMIAGALLDVGDLQKMAIFMELDLISTSTDSSILNVLQRIRQRLRT